MSHPGYVAAAYAVFVLVLARDFLAPRLDIRRQLRASRRRRAAAARPDAGVRELER